MFGSESCSASVVWTSGLLLPLMFISHKLQRNAYLLLFIWQLLIVIILVLCVQIFRYLWHFFQYEGQKWDLIVALTGFCKIWIWIQVSVELLNLCALPESQNMDNQKHLPDYILQEVREYVSLLSVWTHPLIFWWRCVMSMPVCVSPPHWRQRVHRLSTVKTHKAVFTCPVHWRADKHYAVWKQDINRMWSYKKTSENFK